MSYQLIQLDIAATDNIACPHCQQKIINWQEEQYIQPCEHTLFIAMDIGFEYITDEFEQTMLRSVDDLHANDDLVNMFAEISVSRYPDYLILKSDLGIQGYSRYIGIAP
ncbi:hypothetical protein OC498_02410 [Acinetobacter bohemicus]|uniref:hypothetical protein n=1 Tax=Acinetobacter TaxID=469 RepID=UPI00157D87B5|nr:MULTISPECIES: hypothetical protein [Acinetobacter]MDM1781784.1 hypothetical protein [Acinetobacter indicus]MCO8041751.1 hypothetical protein [Acinetobacter sp. S4400-12]MCO8045372.1 hypothetical protein [Acinetobacter sp. S4397-1]MCU7223768.1 hypothetical protein [Acinetobacter bohemicus]QKQ69800.1 hypothetical protein E5Y90_05930 [Acinetobacter sp. 10FS3-1]